ncbi:MAG TPA: VCBS repeat-containing protein, partial [Verrucomicrobiae bacterium]|nr:VCBS repeat-containing protein [Verrucomicrobiae bacterium]
MKSHILTMIILSASAGGFRAEAQTFGNAVNYKVGSSPYSVVAADVNGDGKVDLISADEGSSTLTILTNNGSGILSSNATCHGLSNPESVVSADVNQDGKVDLIAVCGGTRRLSVLTNDGSGGFVISGNYIGGDYPYLAIAEDVNGDGEKDLIGGNGNSLVVLTNVGDGNFVLASSPGTHGWSFTSGDFNGDGKLDLVQTGASMVPTYHGYFMILTNSGNGTFSLSFTNSISTLWPGAISAADLNGDRKVDLVIPDYNSTEGTNLIVFTNNGTGFLAFDSTYAVTRGPECVIAEDVNGDGKKDLISTSWNLDSTFNGLSILINNGSGK